MTTLPQRMMARLGVMSLAGLLAGLLAACSTGGSSPAASSAPSSIPATGAAAGAAASPGAAATDGAVDGDQIAAQVEAALARSGSVTLTTTGTATQRLLVNYTRSATSFRYTSPARGFIDPVDAVAELIDPTTLMDVGGTLFMATNPQKLPRPWLRITRTASDEWATFLRQNMSATLRNVNPYMIATMFSAADSVWQRPPAGAGARYQVVLRNQNILKVMSADDAERLRSAVTGLTQICEITLDDQHRPMSLRISVSGSNVTQSQSYAGWGNPVTITAPSSADVMDTPMLSTLGYTTGQVLLGK